MNERRFFPFLRTTALLAGLLALAGCGGTVPPALVGTAAAPQSHSSQTGRPAAPPVPASQATFAFEPFVGVPGNTADSLSRRIGEEAKAQGLTIVRRIGAPATYRVKGHLSAVGDNSSSTVIYVFDVYDANGNRLHRFSGQETSNETSADPWSGIDGNALDLLAKRTVMALQSWLTSAPDGQ
ncbi:hypothetical protein C8N35_1176 [Breoghania corrubedonensis]|uniref:Lipoprotein n=1 Tax=Breoghania corrubedonensis TaxID=665038 RepID=A0A2T5UNV0_9HYPH|nr:hypothetical protein [Breoghania corrubedonensis]PTW53190.1 hypothetical protein C8N35_1176 [Breoghania corrubedonensis]